MSSTKDVAYDECHDDPGPYRPRVNARRPPTVKRKQQNRAAQRKYREKLKARLETLERLASGNDATQSSLMSTDIEVTDQNNESRTILAPENEDTRNSSTNLVPCCQSRTSNCRCEGNSAISLDGLRHQAHQNFKDPALDELSRFYARDSLGLIENNTPLVFDDVEGRPLDTSQLTQCTFEAFDARPSELSCKHLPSNWSEPFFADITEGGYQDNTIVELDSTANLVTPDNTRYAASEGVPSSSPQKYMSPAVTRLIDRDYTDLEEPEFDISRQLRSDDSHENQRPVKTAISGRNNSRDTLLIDSTSVGGVQNMEQTSLPELATVLPDIHKNSLTLVRTSTLQAYLSNANAMMTIGLSIPALYDESATSPFYRPYISTSQDVEAILATYTSRVVVHLKPTALQITSFHHPWLDLIPFPAIRERLLKLLSMTPPMIDVMEFKSDVFLKNGLFCWRASEKKGSGQPWDMRSWEAEPWFLRKWWMLMGGEDADIWSQTRWWRSMREEEEVNLQWVI
ncbi:hypothetical protein OIDMADRAFT_149434 [Oidiodendron maius Zn]|uniref:BZIP domain-containing protein n=1 Tax=Oidiodendron maius (strain Zn) TaxID=913774 RepID=A0A0C3CXD5_OIDMZ|nr:hypothetical protein OIDMADRAFT_149434 [Oidiodendron maius Zn]